jgi:CO/xanthine dehydrogenase Mo-binding subunit
VRGARRFGWADRDPQPGARRDGRWLTGTGVAASTYPARRRPSRATVTARDGEFVVEIAATDIGTGARTALTQIAADALGTGPDRVRVELGDSDLPQGFLAGGSMSTASWGSAVVMACQDLLKSSGTAGRADTTDDVAEDSAFAGRMHHADAHLLLVLLGPVGRARQQKEAAMTAAHPGAESQARAITHHCASPMLIRWRWPLRPDAKYRRGPPAPQHAWPGTDRL